MANQNTSALAQQIMQNGNTYAPVDNNNKKTEWEKILAMLAMSDKMDWRTMAGFGLGKLLRDGFDTWKGNYDARGYINNEILTANPEERQKKLDFLKQNNSKQYSRTMNYLNKWGVDLNAPAQQQNTGTAPQPATNEIGNALQRYAEKINQAENPYLGEEYLPEVEQSFSQTPTETNPFIEYLRSLQGRR